MKMVNGGTVRGDLTQITSLLNDYSSRIEELPSCWKGDSYDNLESKAEQFASEFTSSISSQMNDFASACDEYLTYERKKQALETAESNYQIAVDSDDEIAKACYSSRISSLTEDVREIKERMRALLASASSYTLEASLKSYSPGDGSTANLRAIEATSSVFEGVRNLFANNPITASAENSTAQEAEAKTEAVNNTSSGSSGSRVTSTMQKVADVAAQNSGRGYDNYCEKWAEEQWEAATGIPRQRATSAYTAWQTFGVSTSKDNIPVGAMVYGSGSGSGNGHVGIYVGDGKVADQGGVMTLDSWLSWQKPDAHGNNGWIGWGWQNGIDLAQG